MPHTGSRRAALWALAPDIHFLNHGSFGACPRSVLEEQERWRLRMEAQPIHHMARQVGPGLRRAAERVGAVLGAQGRDLAFVTNATSGVNAVLRGLELEPGDRIVTTTHAYPAVRNAIDYVAQRSGAQVVEVPIPFPVEGPEQVIERLELALPGARLAVLDHITSATGLVLPIQQMVARCRHHGVPVLVDGAHAPGQVPVNLEALGADWWTGNLHKWLFAPKGTAVLWASPERQGELEPLTVSHGFGQGYTQTFDWQGTQDFSGWLSVPSALDFIESLGGLQAIWAHNNGLCAQASARLMERWGVPPASPSSMRAAMATLALPLPGIPSIEGLEALHDALWYRHRIEVPIVLVDGRLWLRISAQMYNDLASYDVLAEAVLEVMGRPPAPVRRRVS